MRADGIITVILIFVALTILLIWESGHGKRLWLQVKTVPDDVVTDAQESNIEFWTTYGDYSNNQVPGEYAGPWALKGL